MKVIGTTPSVDASEEDIRFRLEILYPERSFKDAIRLTGDKAHRGTTQFTDSLTAFPDNQKIGEAGKRISDQMFKNGFNAWRNMHKNALKANPDVPERDLRNRIVSDPLTAAPYVWTKEDAEEVASHITPGHWAFQ